METRTIKLTLEKAREWYNSGNDDLKEVALQAYSDDELKEINFREIKTFADVCIASNINEFIMDLSFLAPIDTEAAQVRAITKVDLIRKALNGDWKPSLTAGKIYYPFVKFYPADTAEKEASNNGWSVGASFIADGEKFTLVGGDYAFCSSSGLGGFGYGYGGASAALGLLGCRSMEVAKHISRYFSKEIFEACYAHHYNYKWCD